MNNLKSICVFCGSSEGTDSAIIKESELLGAKMAERDITLIYGGSKMGIMGRVAIACLGNKGKAIGIIPGFLKTKEIVHEGLDELVTTENMHERKLKMQEMSDGFITLPGGFGTFEELFEIITWSQLGLHHKPIGILNTNGFYDHLIAMLDEMVNRGFLKAENRALLIEDTDVDSLLNKMEHFVPDLTSKWLKPENT
ncbi:TIGR00730 family Rossman fold protein [Leeuwenhoekiella sp. MAR_2009_132]|uniref:LOG family protein n=1 Tax=Leeuwenhoekiella sp. MAR_2009_132 TaxID=1392489 RepID=UPI00048CD3BA|nr:TIGR00730 family Rossman fold protein [Leeuwenhoekiella sp. MAR_2009_132]